MMLSGFFLAQKSKKNLISSSYASTNDDNIESMEPDYDETKK